MNDFLAKPCTIEELATCLMKWLPVPPARDVGARLPERGDLPAPGNASDFDELAVERIRRLRRPDGSRMLNHAVELFRVASEQSVVSMRAALESQDCASLRFAAHKLKSACANLGAVTMANLCRELEQKAQAGKTCGADELIEQIESQRICVNGWLEEQIRA